MLKGRFIRMLPLPIRSIDRPNSVLAPDQPNRQVAFLKRSNHQAIFSYLALDWLSGSDPRTLFGYMQIVRNYSSHEKCILRVHVTPIRITYLNLTR